MIIDQILPVGVSLLHGKAKTGKSNLAIAMASAVLRGEPFLGLYRVRAGGALLCLDTNPRHLPKYLRDARFTLNPPPLGMDFVKLLRNTAAAPYARIVVIDPLTQILPSWGIEEQLAFVRDLTVEAYERELAVILVYTTRIVDDGHVSLSITAAASMERCMELRRPYQAGQPQQLHIIGRQTDLRLNLVRNWRHDPATDECFD